MFRPIKAAVEAEKKGNGGGEMTRSKLLERWNLFTWLIPVTLLGLCCSRRGMGEFNGHEAS